MRPHPLLPPLGPQLGQTSEMLASGERRAAGTSGRRLVSVTGSWHLFVVVSALTRISVCFIEVVWVQLAAGQVSWVHEKLRIPKQQVGGEQLAIDRHRVQEEECVPRSGY